MTSPVFVSISKKDKSCLSIVFKYRPLILAACLSPVTIQQETSAKQTPNTESGKCSQPKKRNHIKAHLVAATDCEPVYLIRLLQGKLRNKLAGKSLLAAWGQATSYAEKHNTKPSDFQTPLEEAAKIVKQGYSVLPVYDIIVPALLANGVWNLPKTCDFTLGVPIGPMLAKGKKTVLDIVEKFQNAELTCEYKYDGERAQIHYLENGSVEIYSRNAERNTSKYPDVVAAVTRLKKSSVKSFVLDCQIVAYNRDEKRILPFQILTTQLRKNVVMSDIKINVCIFAFDILYLNGEALLQKQLELRRQLLYNSFEEEVGYFQYGTAITSNDVEEIQEFLDAAVDASHWVISKPKSYYRYGEKLEPDAWFEPSEVWEVKAADLTISRVHRAAVGLVNSEKGISLRFPRLMRVREDKSPEQATSSEQVAEMYNAQKNTQPNNQGENEDDDLSDSNEDNIQTM
ncbi:DNA ligase 1 [Euphorbia peplus]|nr:DNA ligase 1 [Euphorbia peplus]